MRDKLAALTGKAADQGESTEKAEKKGKKGKAPAADEGGGDDES